jgi:parallel beta-helix repeat protein
MNGIIQVMGNYNQIDANHPLGIHLGDNKGDGPSFNLIEDNICQWIELSRSPNNIILNNHVSSGFSYGIEVSRSDGNLICKNQVSGQSYAYRVKFYRSSNNIVQANTMSFSSVDSLELYLAYNNLFTRNNIVGRAQVTDGTSISIWSDMNLGNYWGDYLTKYPNATEIDSTGVGNIPYVINDNNTDAYPLMAQYDISTAVIQLPTWTNISLPALLPTPTFPPLPPPTPSPSPTPTPSATLATVKATVNNGSTVDLAISGNITSIQMFNVTISTNQFAATLSFTVTGESGATGFGNITIPKSAVPFGSTPILYIDNQAASDQGYTQNAENYYVWYTTNFSTHEISIAFNTVQFPSSTIKPTSLAEPFSTTIVAATSTIAVAVVVAGLLVYRKKSRKRQAD